jgi:hypothetical protein
MNNFTRVIENSNFSLINSKVRNNKSEGYFINALNSEQNIINSSFIVNNQK